MDNQKRRLQKTQAPDKLQIQTKKQPEPTTAVADPISALQRAYADPYTPDNNKILQRTIGNRAVGHLITQRLGIQTKLTVGPANDQYEQEADRVANQVVTNLASKPTNQPPIQRQEDEDKLQTKPIATLQRHPGHSDGEEIQTKRVTTPITAFIQRHPSHAEEEEVQAKFINPYFQRHPSHAEEEDVQAKPIGTEGGEIGGDFENRLNNSGGGKPLPNDLRSGMESQIGADFSGVRVHTGSNAIQLSRDINAQAFTHGQNVFFGEGYYTPGTQSGQHLIAHELTHVAQQNPGVIQPQRKVNDHDNPNHIQRITPKQVSPKRIQRGFLGTIGRGLRKVGQGIGALAGGVVGAGLGTPAGAIVGSVAGAITAAVGLVGGLVGGAYMGAKAGGEYGDNVVTKFLAGTAGLIGGAIAGSVAGTVAGATAGAGMAVAGTLGGGALGGALGGGLGFEYADVKQILSKTKRQKQLGDKYSTQIGSDEAPMGHDMLDSLDSVLSSIPRSHTKGNPELEKIADVQPDKDLPITGASSYNPKTKQLNIVRPEIPGLGMRIPKALYQSMHKGAWRSVMDKVAMEPFFKRKGKRAQVYETEDVALGLGKEGKNPLRSLFGKDAPMNNENLYDWTIRHELGHAVDKRIKFTEKRARLTEFGGWKKYKTNEADARRNLAKTFLTQGGIPSTVYNQDISYTFQKSEIDKEATEKHRKQKMDEYYAEGTKLSDRDYEKSQNHIIKHNVSYTSHNNLLDIFSDHLKNKSQTVEEYHEKVIEKLNSAMKDWNETQKQPWFQQNDPGIRRAARALRIAQTAPYFLSDGGPELFDGRVYQIDHYGSWVSYLKTARNHLVSNYQFSSPSEWFAEAYAAYYNPGNKTARDKLNPATLNWFKENLGEPLVTGKQQQDEDEKDEKGLTPELDVLADLEDYGVEEDQEESAGRDAKDLELIAERLARIVERNEDQIDDQQVDPEASDEPKMQLVPRSGLRRGDILMLHGGSEGVIAGQAFGNVLRGVFKGIVTPWAIKEYSMTKFAGFGHATIYLGNETISHATNSGVKTDTIPSGEEYYVFRNADQTLANQAATVAVRWDNKMKYDAVKATLGGGIGPSFLGPIGKDRARKMQKGDLPSGMFCSEFVIAAYQVAALNLMDQGNPDTELLSLTAQSASPQRLVAVLFEKSEGSDPTWAFVGAHLGK